jgi:uncharacterized membrane protein YkgB
MIVERWKQVGGFFERADQAITAWMARHGLVLLRVSLGIVFLWFGALKLFPDASPAQDLATRTISVLTAGIVVGATVRGGAMRAEPR